MASRITAYESGIHLNFLAVDPATWHTQDGRKYLEISPMGLLPALRLDDGFLLTDDAAILQHLAACSTTSNLAPVSRLDLDTVHHWLRMIGVDLRQAVSAALDKRAIGATGTHTTAFVLASLDFLNDQLRQRQFLLKRFSIADACLFSLLKDMASTSVDLCAWPAIEAYNERLLTRASVSRAFAEELALHGADVVRRESYGETSYRECV